MTSEDDCLVKYAFNEQKSLNMSWYRRINSLPKPTKISERQANRKLVFYNSFKSSFGSEKYLDAQLGYKDLKRTVQFRMSSRKYNIETWRYGSKYGNVFYRICEQCSTDDKETLELLKESPFFKPIVEDEFHVLNSCSRVMRMPKQKLKIQLHN